MDIHKIHGHTVHIEPGAEHAVTHFNGSIQADEANVFFHEARRNGKAQFEDHHGRNYTLTHNSDATFTITRRP